MVVGSKAEAAHSEGTYEQTGEEGLSLPQELVTPTVYRKLSTGTAGNQGADASDAGTGDAQPESLRDTQSALAYRGVSISNRYKLAGKSTADKEREANHFARSIAGGTYSHKFEDDTRSSRANRRHRLPMDFSRNVEQHSGSSTAGIQVHVGAKANQKALAAGAQAVTEGQNIYFRQGAYQPSTSSGRYLLAHETAHALYHNDGKLNASPLPEEWSAAIKYNAENHSFFDKGTTYVKLAVLSNDVATFNHFVESQSMGAAFFVLVYKAQRFLNVSSGAGLVEDGRFTPETQKALESWFTEAIKHNQHPKLMKAYETELLIDAEPLQNPGGIYATAISSNLTDGEDRAIRVLALQRDTFLPVEMQTGKLYDGMGPESGITAHYKGPRTKQLFDEDLSADGQEQAYRTQLFGQTPGSWQVVKVYRTRLNGDTFDFVFINDGGRWLEINIYFVESEAEKGTNITDNEYVTVHFNLENEAITSVDVQKLVTTKDGKTQIVCATGEGQYFTIEHTFSTNTTWNPPKRIHQFIGPNHQAGNIPGLSDLQILEVVSRQSYIDDQSIETPQKVEGKPYLSAAAIWETALVGRWLACSELFTGTDAYQERHQDDAGRVDYWQKLTPVLSKDYWVYDQFKPHEEKQKAAQADRLVKAMDILLANARQLEHFTNPQSHPEELAAEASAIAADSMAMFARALYEIYLNEKQGNKYLVMAQKHLSSVVERIGMLYLQDGKGLDKRILKLLEYKQNFKQIRISKSPSYWGVEKFLGLTNDGDFFDKAATNNMRYYENLANQRKRQKESANTRNAGNWAIRTSAVLDVHLVTMGMLSTFEVLDGLLQNYSSLLDNIVPGESMKPKLKGYHGQISGMMQIANLAVVGKYEDEGARALVQTGVLDRFVALSSSKTFQKDLKDIVARAKKIDESWAKKVVQVLTFVITFLILVAAIYFGSIVGAFVAGLAEASVIVPTFAAQALGVISEAIVFTAVEHGLNTVFFGQEEDVNIWHKMIANVGIFGTMRVTGNMLSSALKMKPGVKPTVGQSVKHTAGMLGVMQVLANAAHFIDKDTRWTLMGPEQQLQTFFGNVMMLHAAKLGRFLAKPITTRIDVAVRIKKHKDFARELGELEDGNRKVKADMEEFMAMNSKTFNPNRAVEIINNLEVQMRAELELFSRAAQKNVINQSEYIRVNRLYEALVVEVELHLIRMGVEMKLTNGDLKIHGRNTVIFKEGTDLSRFEVKPTNGYRGRVFREGSKGIKNLFLETGEVLHFIPESQAPGGRTNVNNSLRKAGVDPEVAKDVFRSDKSAYLNVQMRRAIEVYKWRPEDGFDKLPPSIRAKVEGYWNVKGKYPEVTDKNAISGLALLANKHPQVLIQYPGANMDPQVLTKAGVIVYTGSQYGKATRLLEAEYTRIQQEKRIREEKLREQEAAKRKAFDEDLRWYPEIYNKLQELEADIPNVHDLFYTDYGDAGDQVLSKLEENCAEGLIKYAPVTGKPGQTRVLLDAVQNLVRQEHYLKASDTDFNGMVKNVNHLGTQFSSLGIQEGYEMDVRLGNLKEIRFDYGMWEPQTARQFFRATGPHMYDLVMDSGAYAKLDVKTGRFLLIDGEYEIFVRFVPVRVGENEAPWQQDPRTHNKYMEIDYNMTDFKQIQEFLVNRVTSIRNAIGEHGAQIIEIVPELGGYIITDPMRTTTFIGKVSETKNLKKQVGNMKHVLVGEVPGGINLLNLPEPYFNGPTWWVDNNRPWMLRALYRGDDIYLASPVKNIDMSKDNILYSKQWGPSYYANELNTCAEWGYQPLNTTDAEWAYIKGLLKEIFKDD